MSPQDELALLRGAAADLLLAIEELPLDPPAVLRKHIAEVRGLLTRGAAQHSAMLAAAVGEIAALGSTVQEILGVSRIATIVLHRQMTCTAIRRGSDLSFPAIGRLMQIDHSTAQHSVKRVNLFIDAVELSNCELSVLAKATEAVKRAALLGDEENDGRTKDVHFASS
jgi:hypothetical protein